MVVMIMLKKIISNIIAVVQAAVVLAIIGRIIQFLKGM
jgi:hypothetical protein